MSTSGTISEHRSEFTAHPSFAFTSAPFLLSTIQQFRSSASNMTSASNGSGLLDRVPNWLGLKPIANGLGWLQSRGSIIAEATGEGPMVIETAIQGSTFVQGATASAAAGAATEAAGASALRRALTLQHVKNFGGIFTYMTSKWALACFTLVRRCYTKFILAASPIRLFQNTSQRDVDRGLK